MNSLVRSFLVFLHVVFCLSADGERSFEHRGVEVDFGEERGRELLLAGDYIIDNIWEDGARLYVTREERIQLRDAGWTYRELPSPQLRKKIGGKAQLGEYHSYSEVLSFLSDMQTAYPGICQVSNIGQSVEGRDLRVIKITDNPTEEEDEPEFKYVATMHGDELLRTEMCLYFIDELLSNYGSDPTITNLINTTEIWILPLMNPDGREVLDRFNAEGDDLNRTFPDGSNEEIGNLFDGPEPDLIELPPEVAHVITWSAANSFVLSANFHGGALVANYPYDNDGLGSVDSPTSDDALFEFLALTYSIHNPPMWNSPFFENGISNGAAWFSIDGGMQDWNYRYLSCNEITMEISNQFIPPQSQIPQFWTENRDSMMAYLEAVHLGIRGVITDGDTGEPVFAKVLVEGNTQAVYTDPQVGDYHRMLLPGTYSLSYHADGYVPASVEDLTVNAESATRADLVLYQTVRPDFDDDGFPDGEDPDDDDDGLPDNWELAYGLNPYDSADALLDGDGDGLANLGEYLAGTLPDDGSSFLQIIAMTLSDTGSHLTWISVPGRSYRISHSDALDEPFVPVVEGVVALSGETSEALPFSSEATRGFFRVDVE
ncbi:M14 family zinc carboxypeptidase [Roseibacillus persicicus]|nr:M14 family zinc carboxypeptidase [Roseibacillus persicicus]